MAGKNDIIVSTRDLKKGIRDFVTDVQKLLLRYPQTVTFADKLERRVLALDSGVSNVVIMGRQGTGKSMLLNAIIGKDRARTGHTVTTTTIDSFQFRHTNILDTPGTYSTETQNDETIAKFLEGDHEVIIQQGVIPHALIYVVSEEDTHTISKVSEDIEHYTQSLGILPEYRIVVVQKWDIADSPDEKAEEMVELFREHLQDQVSTILPTSGLLANVCREVNEDVWMELSKHGAETSAENLEILIDRPDMMPTEGIEVSSDVLKLNLHVRKFSLLLARSQNIGNGKDLREAILKKSGIETLRKKLSHFFEQKSGRESSTHGLVRSLTAYRILSNIQEEAVSLLEEIVKDEETHKQQGERLKNTLSNTTAPTTPLFSLRDSLEALEAARACYTIIQDVHKPLANDLAERKELVENLKKVLAEMREAVAPSPASWPGQQADRLNEVLEKEESRFQKSQETWKKSLSAIPQAIAGLDSVKIYLTESGHPSSIHDICYTTQAYLNDWMPRMEARITQVNKLLEDLHETKAEIQQYVDLFEEDVRCLTLLETAENCEIVDQDKVKLLRLFGQYGTSRSRRLILTPKARKNPKQYVQECIKYWSDQRFNALDLELERIFDHAIERLEIILSKL